MFKPKALVIEDDPIQVQGLDDASIISGYTAAKDILKTKSHGFDFILTDLFLPFGGLPEGTKDMPIPRIDLFAKIIDQYVRGVIKGAALVSNFEHHTHGLEEEKFRRIDDLVDALQPIKNAGIKVDIDFKSRELKFTRNLKSLNIIVFLDSLS